MSESCYRDWFHFDFGLLGYVCLSSRVQRMRLCQIGAFVLDPDADRKAIQESQDLRTACLGQTHVNLIIAAPSTFDI